MASDAKHHNSGNGSTHSLVADSNGGEGLIVVGHGVAHPGGLGIPPTTPEILSNSMDPIWLLHSLRRRWVLAAGLGLLFGGALAVLVWFLTPSVTTATSTIIVASRPPRMAFSVDSGDPDFEVFKKTQLDYVKSNIVLQSALTSLSRQGLPEVLRDVPENERAAWLKDNVEAGFPTGAEFMYVVTELENAQDAVRVVNSVVDAYMSEVVDLARQRRMNQVVLLQGSVDTLNDQIMALFARHRQTALEANAPDAPGAGVDRAQLQTELEQLGRQKFEYERQIFQDQWAIEAASVQQQNPLYQEQYIQKAVSEDPKAQIYQLQINQLTALIVRDSSLVSARRPDAEHLAGYKQQIAKLQADKSQRERELAEQWRQGLTREPSSAFQLQKEAAKFRINKYQGLLAKTVDEIETKTEELKDRLERSLEADQIQGQIDTKTKLAETMQNKIATLDIERAAGERIEVYERAIPTPGYNTLQRTIMVTFGGLFGLGLTCFAVALFEYRHKKLNGASQMDEGLGIRVVGNLPRLAVRRSNDDSDPVLAVLTESIDGVRTALMHASSTSNTKVVMVTSPGEHEGRTTVASQLAASLARAGRRTLLVDGDLRHPSLHMLFDVPVNDGMCEVLRAEVDVEDVIRPTHAEGLWLMTAGYCDVTAIQALARDQAQPIFDKLRNEYDFVIVDSAPVLNLSDSLIMGQYTDGAILSVVRDFSRVPRIHEASEMLRSVGIRVLGSVLNGVAVKPCNRVQRLRLAAPESAATK